MDAIAGLDEGTYAFFDFLTGKHPGMRPVMQPAYYLSGYVGIGVLFAITILLFVIQSNRRAVLVTIGSGVVALLLIEAMRIVVPRVRPQNAAIWLGEGAQIGSYPAAGVLLFLLGMNLLGMALWRRARPTVRVLYVAVAALLTIWVCVSQFVLALHYLSDVLGGLAGALLLSWIAGFFMRAEARTSSSSDPQALG